MRRSLLLALAGAAVVATVLTGASLLLRDGDEESPGVASSTTLVDGIPQQNTVLGDPAATVTLIQYEDLQCPVCKRYMDDVFPAIVEEYVRPGHVKVDLRGLEFIGDDSNEALRAVLAAARQDKAWQLNELLYDAQGAENSGWVTEELIRELGGKIDGLEVETMVADAAGADVTQEIDAVKTEAAQLRVGGTPWFFVEIEGQQAYQVSPPALTPDVFRAILDDALSSA